MRRFLVADSAVNWLWLMLPLLALDQGTKWWVSHSFNLFESKAVAPFLQFTLMHNTGAAFSFLADASGWQRWFFIGLGVAVIVGLLLWLRRIPRDQHWVPAALALLAGGALGNVIDRVWHGYVIDFIDVYYGSWHFPAFNVADSALTIGVAMLLIDGFFLSARKQDAA